MNSKCTPKNPRNRYVVFGSNFDNKDVSEWQALGLCEISTDDYRSWLVRASVYERQRCANN